MDTQTTEVKNLNRERLLYEFRKQSSARKIGWEMNHFQMRIALTIFEGREVYVRGNQLYELDFWDLETQRVIFTFENAHSSPILSVAASPDGRFVVSGSMDKTIAVWDLEKKSLHCRFVAHKAPVTALTITKNNKYIVSAFQDSVIRVWAFEKLESENKKVLSLKAAHVGKIWSVTTTPDSDHIISTGEDGVTSVWNISSGKNLHRFTDERSHLMTSSAVTPDGRYAISASADGCVFVWDLRLGVLSYKLTVEGDVRAIAVSPDSKYLYCGCEDGTIAVWTFDGLKKKIKDKSNSGPIWQLQFSLKSKQLVSSTIMGNIVLWDVNQEEPSFRALNHPGGRSEYMRVTPDSKYIISVINRSLNVFSVQKRKFIGVFKEKQDQQIYNMILSQDGKEALIANSDNTITVLNLDTFKITAKIPLSIETDHSDFKMITDGANLIISNDADKYISVVSLKEKKIIYQFEESGVVEIAMSKDSKYLVAGTQENMLVIWDLPSKKLLQRIEEPSKHWPTYLEFTQEGTLLCATWGGHFTLWNTSDGNSKEPLMSITVEDMSVHLTKIIGDSIIFKTNENGKEVINIARLTDFLKEGKQSPNIKTMHLDDRERISNLVANPDCEWIAVELLGRKMEVRSLSTLTRDFTINFDTSHFDHRFQITPDSRSLVVLTRTNHLELWDLERGVHNHRLDRTSEELITVITAYSPTEGSDKRHQYMIVGTEDGSIEKWSITDKKSLSVISKAHDSSIRGLIVTSDSKKLLSLDGKTIKIWNLGGLDLEKDDPEFKPEGENEFTSFAVSSDSKLIAAGTQKSMLVIYSIEKQKAIATIKQIGTQNSDSIRNILITNDSKRVIVSYGNVIGIFRIEPRKLSHLHTFSEKGVFSIAMDSENKRLFSSGDAVKVWDLEKLKLITNLRAESFKTFLAQISPDDKYLAYSADGAISILNLKDSAKPSTIPLAHKAGQSIYDLLVTSDKRYIITICSDRTIILTDFHQKKEVGRFENVFSDTLLSLAATPDLKYLIMASYEKSVAVYDFETRTLHHHFKQLHKERVNCAVSLPDCRTVVTGSDDKSIAVLDIIDKKVVCHIPETHANGGVIDFATMTVMGSTYVISGGDDTVRIWKYQNNELLPIRTYTDPDGNESIVVYTSSNNEYIVASNFEIITIWKFDQEENEPPFRLNSKGAPFVWVSKAPHHDYVVASSSEDKSIQIWDIAHKRLVCHLHDKKRFADINLIRFTPDLKQLVYSVSSEEIGVIDCSFLSNDPQAQQDRIPLLAAIDCYCNPDSYTPAELSERIGELAKWYYLPKGWNFLNYVAFLLPVVDKGMIDIAKDHKITLSVDAEENTQLDYMLEFKGTKKPEIRLFYAYLFANISSFVSVDMPDPSKLLKSLAAQIKNVAENQTETSFVNYLSCFSLEPKDHLKSSELLPVQGEIKNEAKTGYIQLQKLFYNKEEVEKAVSTEGKLTLNYSLLALPNSYDITSQDSLDLIGLLNDSDNVSFYESPTVRTIIEFFWEKSRRYLWYLLAFHIIPVGLFIAFAIERNENYDLASGLLAGVVAITSLLLFAEILQVISDFKEYAQNPFNFIELGMLSIQITNAVLFWVDPTSTATNFFVSLSTILWFFKVLILMRVIDQLRRLIHMIIKIVGDMMSFLLVIFTMMVAFTIAIYQSREADDADTSFWDVALEFYTFGIGSFDSSNYSGVTLPFFILATILMPLILLNMLIAIMGDSYGNANESAVAIDAKERIAMISEISSTVVQLKKIGDFFRPKRLIIRKTLYLLRVEPFESKEEKVSAEDLIKIQDTRIQGAKTEIAAVKNDLEDVKSEIKSISEVVLKLLDKQQGGKINCYLSTPNVIQ